MKQAGIYAMALAALALVPMAFAQDDTDDAILGTWDITYEQGGSEMTAMISVARNSDGRLVGLWTQMPERERINLVTVHFTEGKLTAGRPVLVNDELQTGEIAATINGTAISGTVDGVQFKGVKRGAKASADDEGEGRGRRGGGRNGGGRNFDVGALIAQADANGDGMLQESEAPERMKQFFSMMDADGDGNVTKEEAESAFERFQGNRN